MRLENKVAIVTGGGTGIGEAIARAFAREGATVAITGRRKEELERVVKDIEQHGGHALALQGSVTNEPDVREAVEATVRTFGRLDILVNNAGNLFYSGPLHETPDQIWIEPPPCFSMCGIAARMNRNGPFMNKSNVSSHIWSGVSWSGPE